MNEAQRAQVRAATPTASSWVSANAGSGKTRVLTDRVARLLLAGTEPQKILCLTYTKAAAAEMQNRLYRTLGGWAMLDDPALRAALAALGEPADTLPPARLDRARTLFARALETPGGLKIQTIHAFCEALLRRFPLEAGVAPQFRVLDDRQARALRADVLDEIAARPGVFADLARNLAGDDPDALLQEIAQHRAAFAGGFDAGALDRALGAEPGLTVATLAEAVLTPEAEAMLRGLLPLLAASGKADSRAGETLAAALGSSDPETRLAGLEAVLLSGSGSKAPFSAKVGQFPTKGLRTAHPGLTGRLDALMRRVEAARPRRLARAAADRSAALNRFGRAWLAAWRAAKAARGLLDFDDMIDGAQALLERPGVAAWVLWRLDGGLDHLLVDEAQDTSPAQWRVIEAVSAEFFAGTGARDVERTLFVVGDEKQSIYSFQGADPEEFGAKGRHYARVLDEIGREMQRCALLHSFRSARPILALVDAVFSGPAGEGLDAGTTHHAFDGDKPGRVELWPFLEKPDRPDERPWHEPVDAVVPDDPVETLAGRIAGTIAGWLAAGRALPGEPDGRAIRAGDVMILVQRRGPIFEAVIRALKRARVPVAGADLLRIGGELAVKDILAALRFAATPADDLSLAAFLRSPMGGVDEAALFTLAHGREGRLWDALRARPAERWPEARALLQDLRDQADFLRPFELIQRMLIRHGGRRALIARLGHEAEDGIDALIDQALAYEQVEAPSLTGFLDWIDRDEVAVKRRSEEGADQVRVMTVHGAKGLEAPIVILPDTAARQDGAKPPQVLRLGGGEPAWSIRRDGAPPALIAAEADRRRLVRYENRRLLYVALTRAQRWLIVCGAGAPGNGNSESWHALVGDALAELAPTVEPDGETLSLSHNWREDRAPGVATAAGGTSLPAWAGTAAGRPPEAGRVLSPSLLGGDLVLAGEALGDAEGARLRGIAVHALLEHLHGQPAAARAAIAARLLPGAADLDALVAEAGRLLDDPALAPLFGPGSFAEVEVTAPVGALRVAGRIDRLVVTPDRVLAIDFKSNRAVPGRAEDVPEGILRQLGAYRAGLAAIWADREVATAVLWTRTGRLMPVPAALVDAALGRATLDPHGVGS